MPEVMLVVVCPKVSKPRQVASGETTMGVARGKASGPTGGVFGCSDHFETPVAKEEWFWFPVAFA